MIRKLIFALSFVFVVAAGTPVFGNVHFSSSVQMGQTETVPPQVVALACLKVEEARIGSACDALNWYRAGTLTITKIESGKYRVEYGGGSWITILETDAL